MLTQTQLPSNWWLAAGVFVVKEGGFHVLNQGEPPIQATKRYLNRHSWPHEHSAKRKWNSKTRMVGTIRICSEEAC